MEVNPTKQRPSIAIIDSNMLAVMGLRQILQDVMPIMDVRAFLSFDDFEAHEPDAFVHYFVAVNIVVNHRPFFLAYRNKTIVLTVSDNPNSQLGEFHGLAVNVPESQLIKSVLQLEQHAHAHGRNLPPMPRMMQARVLSDREIEVLSLIVQGYINKEIADQLNIGLTTVISHRKNIMEKLGVKSVSALTIYAVMHGYVDINKI